MPHHLIERSYDPAMVSEAFLRDWICDSLNVQRTILRLVLDISSVRGKYTTLHLSERSRLPLPVVPHHKCIHMIFSNVADLLIPRRLGERFIDVTQRPDNFNPVMEADNSLLALAGIELVRRYAHDEAIP